MKILIAGMGRSGTSFLMKMFYDLGMPAYCSSDKYINDEISAGLEISVEQCLEFIEDRDKQGVAKSPWIYEICQCDEFCSENINLVIIPIRDPKIATMSRLINEIKSISFDSKNPTIKQSFGKADAGNHYFLDGFEEMRCLSTALALLLYECSKKNITVSFAPFPEIGDQKIANQWAQSIEPFTKQLGISAKQITNWIHQNFDNKRIHQNDKNSIETFEEYLRTTREIELNDQLSSASGFIKAHSKYIRSHRNRIVELTEEAEKVRAKAERARAEAERARAEAEAIKSSIFWKITNPARKLIDRLKPIITKFISKNA